MRFMRRRFLGLAGVAIVAALLSIAWTDPLRRSDAGVESWVLKRTPLGSTVLEVRDVATAQGWFDPNLQASDGRTTGEYLRGSLGDYWSIPFMTNVTVFWNFDEVGKLSSVRVWRTTDGF